MHLNRHHIQRSFAHAKFIPCWSNVHILWIGWKLSEPNALDLTEAWTAGLKQKANDSL
jgi:hypothetical protein